MQYGTKRKLSAGERAAYDAPFPSADFKVAARVYPSLVPATPDNPASEANRHAWQVFERWDKPFVCCFSDGDPITRGVDTVRPIVCPARVANPTPRCAAATSCRRTMRKPLHGSCSR